MAQQHGSASVGAHNSFHDGLDNEDFPTEPFDIVVLPRPRWQYPARGVVAFRNGKGVMVRKFVKM